MVSRTFTKNFNILECFYARLGSLREIAKDLIVGSDFIFIVKILSISMTCQLFIYTVQFYHLVSIFDKSNKNAHLECQL